MFHRVALLHRFCATGASLSAGAPLLRKITAGADDLAAICENVRKNGCVPRCAATRVSEDNRRYRTLVRAKKLFSNRKTLMPSSDGRPPTQRRNGASLLESRVARSDIVRSEAMLLASGRYLPSHSFPSSSASCSRIHLFPLFPTEPWPTWAITRTPLGK